MAITNPLTLLLNLILSVWCSFFGCGSPNDNSNTSQSPGVAVAEETKPPYAREIQIHSSILYKVSIAISAEDPNLKTTEIAQAVTKVCAQNNVQSVIVKNKKFNYGWSSAPKNIKCSVEARDNSDFKVTVRGETGITSVNGENPR